MARVLAFPVTPDNQLSAFPYGSPDTVIQHLEHELIRLYRLRASMSPQQSIRALGEISLLAGCVDLIEADCRRVVERQAKAVGLIA